MKLKKNPDRYNSLEQDSIFVRISKAIVREAYPIIFGEEKFQDLQAQRPGIITPTKMINFWIKLK